MLPNNKAYGLYSCPVSILKLSSHIISQPLAQIFNVSVSSGSFPAKLKTAKVVPVFKSGDESKPGNYRPISLFNYQFSTEYLKSWFIKDLLIIYSSQYGFRSRHSTQHATLEILNDILSNFDKGQFTFCLFIDLKKAFDTVNYDILLSKLKNYGFRGVVNDWFKSYLIGRRQYTTINGYISDSPRTLCGVPQGSVLGTLLFLLYINDLYKSSNKLQFYLFADDTSLTYANGDLKKLETEINEELFKVCSSLVVNKLTLNIKKTNYRYIIFHPP